MTVAERPSGNYNVVGFKVLQWGRNLTVAERCGSTDYFERLESFNGAAT